jgi:transcriptional regulator with AAA-type ATPase domain
MSKFERHLFEAFSSYHIENIQELAEKVSERVGVVSAHTVDEISDQSVLTHTSLLNRHRKNSPKTVGDHSHFAFLPVLPNPVRDVEHETLEELMFSLVFVKFELSLFLTWKKSVNGTH